MRPFLAADAMAVSKSLRETGYRVGEGAILVSVTSCAQWQASPSQLPDVDVDDPVNDELDVAYRSKNHRYSGPVASITSELARSATLKLVPQQKK